MKKISFYTTLFLLAAALFACHKYTSIENGAGLPGDFVAQVSSTPWEAVDSTQSAFILQGMITITGINSNGQTLSITLGGTTVGTYVLDQNATSLATFTNQDSTGVYSYSTNESADTALSGGTVTVTSINPVNQTISGIFSFKVYRQLDGSLLNLTAGVFYNLHYLTSVPVSTIKKDTLTATVDNAPWVGQNITAEILNGQLAIEGSVLNGIDAITLILPANSPPGNYPLNFNGNTNYLAIYNPTPSESDLAYTGNLTVLQNNTTTSWMNGTFQFEATNPLGGDSTQVTKGYFSIYYGQ